MGSGTDGRRADLLGFIPFWVGLEIVFVDARGFFFARQREKNVFGGFLVFLLFLGVFCAFFCAFFFAR